MDEYYLNLSDEEIDERVFNLAPNQTESIKLSEKRR